MAINPHPSMQLLSALQDQAASLGFSKVGITDCDVSAHTGFVSSWLDANLHGSMEWMARHQSLREDPSTLLDQGRRIISVALDYWPEIGNEWAVLGDPETAYISRYALGRDYHKLFRKRLVRLAEWLAETIAPHGYRVFSDSAPLLEKHLAEKAGLGWIGKHTLLLSRAGGSYFFLGEILTDYPFALTEQPEQPRCGSCQACLEVCPTQAFIAPYRLDARRCISYLTIEHTGEIPEPLRAPMGNRVFGCDDCQLVCPWNRYAHRGDTAFLPRHGLEGRALLDLFRWNEAEFLAATEGSPLRRAGYVKFLENLAIGLGNGPADPRVLSALEARIGQFGEVLDAHIAWALKRLMRQDRTDASDNA